MAKNNIEQTDEPLVRRGEAVPVDPTTGLAVGQLLLLSAAVDESFVGEAGQRGVAWAVASAHRIGSSLERVRS